MLTNAKGFSWAWWITETGQWCNFNLMQTKWWMVNNNGALHRRVTHRRKTQVYRASYSPPAVTVCGLCFCVGWDYSVAWVWWGNMTTLSSGGQQQEDMFYYLQLFYSVLPEALLVAFCGFWFALKNIFGPLALFIKQCDVYSAVT